MRITVIALTAFLLVAALSACGEKQRYGTVNTSLPLSSVKQVIMNPSLVGTEVRIEGTITTQCASSGCWAFVDDGSGQILVDLKALNLGLPMSTGRKASVSGVVTPFNSQVLVDARGIEVR